MLAYPVNLTQDSNQTYLVTFPDIPEAAAVGEDIEAALLEAEDAIETALDFYFEDRRPIPLPSKPNKGQYTVVLPVLTTSKVLLLNEMIAKNIKKSELARALDVHMPQIDRLLDLRHATKIEFVEKAFAKLGRRLTVHIA